MSLVMQFNFARRNTAQALFSAVVIGHGMISRLCSPKQLGNIFVISSNILNGWWLNGATARKKVSYTTGGGFESRQEGLLSDR